MAIPRARLGSVAEFINGFAFKPEDWADDGLPIVRIQNLTDPGKAFNRTSRRVPEKFVVRPGDLLVSWSATLGVFIWDRLEDGLVNQHIFRVIPDTRVVDKAYLRHMLGDALLSMSSHLHGATMQHVNRGAFLATEIPLPPLPEQRRIASILDEADRVRTYRRIALDHVDAIVDAAFREVSAQTGERILLGNCVKVIAKLVDPRRPEFAQYSFVAPDNIEAKTGRMRNVRSVSEVAPISGKYLFESEDVLYSKIRPALNKVALAHSVGLCSADMYPLRADSKVLTREYLWAALRASDFLKYASGMANRAQMPKLNRDQLFGYPMAVPPISVQERFASVVSRAQRVESAVRQHQASLNELFAALQHRAFSGEL
ncbi:MAG: restriction endonuclease subunit S [Salinibacterium sp.]|nr:restriction endonuclease subunit S [Salinibacterium sp.]